MRSGARAARKAGISRKVFNHVVVIAVIGWAVLGALRAVGAGSLDPPRKKLIEYGWDVPTPAQMDQQLPMMEKRPFDGIIFRLGGGYNAFATNRLDLAKFDEDARILGGLRFTRFTDNFVLIWGSPPSGFDWFARLGRCGHSGAGEDRRQ